MQRKNNNTILKIACATSMCIFSLFACFAGAIAWFTGIRVQDPKNTGMNGKNDDIHAEFSIYKIETTTFRASDKDEQGKILDLTGLKNADGTPYMITDSEGHTTRAPFTLNTYDTIFSARNKYTPALVKIKVYGSSVNEEGSLNITLKRDVSLDSSWTDNAVLNPYLSSVIGVTGGFDSNLYPLLTGSSQYPIDDMYKKALVDFGYTQEKVTDFPEYPVENENAIFEKFTSLTETPGEEEGTIEKEYSKQQIIEISDDYTSTDWVVTGSGETEEKFLNFFVIIDYSRILVNSFSIAESGFSADKLTNPDNIFTNDLLNITVDHN